MTARARLVLQDCREAHARLTDGLQGSEWRRGWTTVVVLLRTVLHVLDKVDAEADARLRATVDEKWEQLKQDKPAPEVFWGFIEEDRNLIIKEYAHRAGQSVNVLVGEGRSQHTYRMNSGPFEGRDPRDVAAGAIEWLGGYLDDVDARREAAESPGA